MTESFDLGALLAALTEAEVDFVVVEGVAAVLHGAPTTTVDLDVVHSGEPDNLDRLWVALQRLDATVRDPADRRIALDRELLASARQLRLLTRHGPLDLLAELHDGRRYADLKPHAVRVTEGEDWGIQVLDLRSLIEIKRSSGRVRDRLQLPLLLALEDERA